MNSIKNTSEKLAAKINSLKLFEDKLKLLKIYLFIAIASNIFLTHPVFAQDGVNGNLVNVEWLNENLNNPGVVILDASPAQIYNSNHIPGAVNVDVFTYGAQDNNVEEVEQLYQSWGISRDKKIVIYDQGEQFSQRDNSSHFIIMVFPQRIFSSLMVDFINGRIKVYL